MTEISLAQLPSTDSSGRSFEWLQLLGRGSFGEVYLAKMRSPDGLERLVAVKLLQQGLDPKSQATERLRDEARLLASLQHPVVLAALALVELSGRVALVTEYIEGEDLSTAIRGEFRMAASTVLEVVEALASALDGAFRQHKVVHRDIKPSNIRIGVHGNVKLLDFGVALSEADREAHTQSHTLMGTQRYAAPERFASNTAPEPASDVFSLGAVLYEGVTGKLFLPELDILDQFRLSAVAQVWDAFLEERLTLVSPSGPAPEGLEALLRAMLSHDPGARPTAGEVAHRCEELTAGFAHHVRLSKWCRARRWPDSPLSVKPTASPTPRPPVGRLWQPALPAPPSQDPPRLDAPEQKESAPTERVAKEPPAAPARADEDASVVTSRSTTSALLGANTAWWMAAATVGGGLLGAMAMGIPMVLLVLQMGLPRADAPSGETPVAPAPDPSAAPELPTAVPEPSPVAAPAHVPRPDPVRAIHETVPKPTVTPRSAPVVPVAPTYEVWFYSEPPGASITLISTGEPDKSLGLTPRQTTLPAGAFKVKMRAASGISIERTLQVGRNKPKRYTWDIESNHFTAGD